MQVNESDWKLFRRKLPEWHEAHINRLNQKYAALLAGTGTAAEKFWQLEEQVNSDKQHVGVVARMSRSNMYHNILALLDGGIITSDDLADFSEELRALLSFRTDGE